MKGWILESAAFKAPESSMKTLFIPDSVLNLIVKSPENLPEQAALLSATVLDSKTCTG